MKGGILMRHFRNKKNIGFVALALVTFVALGAVFIAVQADKPISRNYVFPGIVSQIDALLNKPSSEDNVYQILEILPDHETGRIGYLVEGQEPRPLQDRMELYLKEKGIVSSTSSRLNYMNTTLPSQLSADGLVLVEGDATSEPITSMGQYLEYPFVTMVPTSQGYRTLELEKPETWNIKGEYEANDVGNGNFDTNITGFSYDESNGTYGVNFNGITWSNPKSNKEDDQIYDKIYKTNVGSLGEIYYTEINSGEYLAKIKAIQSNSQGTFVAAMEERQIASYPDGSLIPKTLTNQPYKKIVDLSGNISYQLLSQEEFNATNSYWFVTTVKKAVEGETLQAEDTRCVVQFSESYFQVSDYKYYSESEYAMYRPIIDSDNPYRMANGNGYYDFKPDSTKPEQKVVIGQVYYTGGYQNNNWFKEKLMVSSMANLLPIEVISLTESQFAQLTSQEQEELVDSTDYLMISGSKGDQNFYDLSTSGGSSSFSLTEIQLLATKIKTGVACQIESDVLENMEKLRHDGTSLEELSYLYRLVIRSTTKDISVAVAPSEQDWTNINQKVNGDGRAIYENRYIGGTNKESFYLEFEQLVSNDEFQEVSNYIELENLSRGSQEQLCLDSFGNIKLYTKNLIQYVMNYKSKIALTSKTKIKILDIEPANGKDYKLINNAVDDAKVSSDILTEYDAYQMLRTAYGDGMEFDQLGVTIEIVHMSTAEFIGHNEDLNATYDMIYIGAGYHDDLDRTGDAGSNDVMNRDANGVPKYNDSFMQGLAYAHTGDYVYAWELLGQLDTSYVNVNYTKAYGKGYSNYAYLADAGSSLKTDWINKSGYNVGNLGFYRYSGNDITKIKLKELQEYVKGNNPVVISNDLMSHDDTNGNVVLENRIDNSSYLFDFLEQEKLKPNVMTRSVAPTNTKLINYINITKPIIEFIDNSGEIIEDTTSIGAAGYGSLYSRAYEYGEHIASLEAGKFKTAFRVNNGKTDRTMQSQYVLKFFVDMNSDGKYIKTDDSSELLQDIVLTTGGKPAQKNAEGNYIIWSGKNYSLERSMPASYVGILPWKLEIEQISNSKSRVSHIAYTKSQVNVSTKKVINVLQVTPTSGNNNMDLTTNPIKSMLAELADYNIQVQKVSVSNLATKLAQQVYNGVEWVDGYGFYDMLIVGFEDSYMDATSPSTKSSIIKFAETGKSVLMSHDFVSFQNIEKDQTTSVLGGDTYNFNLADKALNEDFRDLMGLDRYGITTKDKVDSNQSAQSLFLKQGELLNYNSVDRKWYTEWQLNTPTYDAQHKQPGMTGKPSILSQSLLSDRDIAYVPNTNKMQAYGEVEGYSNGQLNRSKANDSSANANKTPLENTRITGTDMLANQADQINNGVITRYPYEIGKKITVVDTHAQYAQLDMDSDKDHDGSPDIVVWYTIAPGSKTGSNTKGSEGDVRNNFYIYSIGNIMYTGFGHSKYNATLDAGQEVKLFINTFVAAYKLQLQEFEITPLESANASAAELDNHLLNTDGVNRLDKTIHFDFFVQDPNLVSDNKTVITTYSLQNAVGDSVPLPSNLTITTTNAETGEILPSLAGSTNGSVLSGMQSGTIYTATLNNIDGINGDFKVVTSIQTTYNYYGKTVTKTVARDVTFSTAVLFNLN